MLYVDVCVGHFVFIYSLEFRHSYPSVHTVYTVTVATRFTLSHACFHTTIFFVGRGKLQPTCADVAVTSRPRRPVAFLFVGRSPFDGSLSALH